MKYGKCPKCSGKKHQLIACSNCGYTVRSGIISPKPVRTEAEKADNKIRAKELKKQEIEGERIRNEMAEQHERAKRIREAENQRDQNHSCYVCGG
jgi:hypothetical protein